VEDVADGGSEPKVCARLFGSTTDCDPKHEAGPRRRATIYSVITPGLFGVLSTVPEINPSFLPTFSYPSFAFPVTISLALQMSSGVKFVFGRGRNCQRQTIIDKLNKTSKQIKERREKHRRTLAGTSLIAAACIYYFSLSCPSALSFADRDTFMASGNSLGDQDIDMDGLGGIAAHEGEAAEESDEEVEAAFGTLPPGEEGILQSHEGGEAMLDNIMSDIRPQYVFFLLLLLCTSLKYPSGIPILVLVNCVFRR
jgi:hypothetical protein